MKKITIYEITCCAIFAALMCVLCPWTIPIGPVPITLLNFILYYGLIVIGAKGTIISFLVYFLLGLFGLPVFSGFSGGVQKLMGPTGGYIIGWFVAILVVGLFYKKKSESKVYLFISLLVGSIVVYLFGTVWFIISMKCDIGYALTACVLPFIPFDLLKLVAAIIIGIPVRQALLKRNLIPETFIDRL